MLCRRPSRKSRSSNRRSAREVQGEVEIGGVGALGEAEIEEAQGKVLIALKGKEKVGGEMERNLVVVPEVKRGKKIGLVQEVKIKRELNQDQGVQNGGKVKKKEGNDLGVEVEKTLHLEKVSLGILTEGGREVVARKSKEAEKTRVVGKEEAPKIDLEVRNVIDLGAGKVIDLVVVIRINPPPGFPTPIYHQIG